MLILKASEGRSYGTWQRAEIWLGKSYCQVQHWKQRNQVAIIRLEGNRTWRIFDNIYIYKYIYIYEKNNFSQSVQASRVSDVSTRSWMFPKTKATTMMHQCKDPEIPREYRLISLFPSESNSFHLIHVSMLCILDETRERKF